MAVEPNLAFLEDEALQSVLALLNQGDGEARIAGGAVRNALLGQDVTDVDIATTLIPRDIMLRARKAGYKPVPTGVEHGTITVVAKDHAFEVTTLRSDVETDGRRAKVLYGTDWEADARRRDLTINALYMDADGTVFDPLGGLPDIEARTVRFVGDPEERIREDYLRILRFFRFFAWYGQHRPDAAGLKACARLKDGIEQLSVERIWQELSKLLAAPDPTRAILWMRQTGVLSRVLPEGEKWGVDSLAPLIRAEKNRGWEPDAVLRLMAIIPPQPGRVEELANRLKLSNKVSDRLRSWAGSAVPDARATPADFARTLYQGDVSGISDRLKLAIAKDDENSGDYLRLLNQLENWKKPNLPVRGRDLIAAGMEPGPDVSARLKDLEDRWVDSDFKLKRKDLLDAVTENQP